MSATTSSASDTGVYIPPATQIVPSIGLDGKPVSTGTGQTSDNGPNDFPAAAIAIISIVAGLIALFIGYKLYVWLHDHLRRQGEEDALPETRALAGGGISPGAGGIGAFASLPSQASFGVAAGGLGSMAGRRSESAFGMYGRSRQPSWGGSEKGDFSPPFPYGGTPVPGSDISRGGSPNSDASRPSPSPFPTSSTRGSLGAPSYPRRSYTSGSQPILMHSRTTSSFSSGQLMPSGNRISGAPHNPHSRIEVVPPMPLAPPPGTVVQTDKSTLDFAPSAGIGQADDGNAAEEWLNLAAVPGASQQETLHDAYHPNQFTSGSSPLPNSYSSNFGAFPARTAAFPPPVPSGSGSTSPRERTRSRPSQPDLRSTIVPPSSSSTTRSPATQSGPSSIQPSPTSSESSLGGGGIGGPNRAMPPPPLHLPHHSSSTSLATSDESSLGGGIEGMSGPRSPLDNLQRRIEREARGLSMMTGPDAGQGTERLRDP
ncbi:hypothetical protein JCM10212_001926 [Sporobolomyces blumeae]